MIELAYTVLCFFTFIVLFDKIKSFDGKYIWISFSLAQFLMIFFPSVYHGFTDYRQILILDYVVRDGFGYYDRLAMGFISAAVYIFFGVFFLKIDGIISDISRRQLTYVRNNGQAKFEVKRMSLALILICFVYFFMLYGGSFANAMLLRSHEALDLPWYFEFFRSGIVIGSSLATYFILELDFSDDASAYILMLILFVCSFGLIMATGSRHLLSFSILTMLLWIFSTKKNRSHVNRRIIFIFTALSALILLAIIQTAFRDGGVGGGQEIDTNAFVAAFDQYGAFTMVYKTVDPYQGYGSNWYPLRGFFDFYMHFLPKSVFSFFGLDKQVYQDYISWNEYISYGVATNITPSVAGLYYIQSGIFGVIDGPLTMGLIFLSLIVMRFKLMRGGQGSDFDYIALALLAGGIFNSVRFFGGGYFFYFIAFLFLSKLNRGTVK